MQQHNQREGNIAALFSPELVEQLKNQYTVNDIDRMGVLMETGTNAPYKMIQMKVLLRNGMAHKTSLLKMAGNVNHVMNTDLHQSLVTRKEEL